MISLTLFYRTNSCGRMAQDLDANHTKGTRTLMRSYRETEGMTCLCHRGETIWTEQTATLIHAKGTFLERRITTEVLRTYISRQVYSAFLGNPRSPIQSAGRFFRDTAVTKQIISNQFLNFHIFHANLYNRTSRTITSYT